MPKYTLFIKTVFVLLIRLFRLLCSVRHFSFTCACIRAHARLILFWWMELPLCFAQKKNKKKSTKFYAMLKRRCCESNLHDSSQLRSLNKHIFLNEWDTLREKMESQSQQNQFRTNDKLAFSIVIVSFQHTNNIAMLLNNSFEYSTHTASGQRGNQQKSRQIKPK